MIASLGPGLEKVLIQSNAVLSLYEENPSIDELCALGVDYLYDGFKEPFDEKKFVLDRILDLPNVELLYDLENVEIFKICN